MGQAVWQASRMRRQRTDGFRMASKKPKRKLPPRETPPERPPLADVFFWTQVASLTLGGSLIVWAGAPGFIGHTALEPPWWLILSQSEELLLLAAVFIGAVPMIRRRRRSALVITFLASAAILFAALLTLATSREAGAAFVTILSAAVAAASWLALDSVLRERRHRTAVKVGIQVRLRK
jgi:hypothetical protein